MQNELSVNAAPVALTGRTVDEITADIRVNYRNAKASIIQIGRDLAEVRQILQHGEWLPYLKGLNISVSTAENYIHYAGEVTEDERLAALPYSGAMALIALPEGEREQLLADDGIKDTSATEITRLAAEVKRERARADQAEAAKMSAQQSYKVLEQSNDELRGMLKAAQNAPAQVIEKEVAPADYADLKDEVKALRRRAEEAEDAAAEAEERAAAAVDQAQRAEMSQLDEDDTDDTPTGKPLLDDYISICNDFNAKVWAVPYMQDVFRAMAPDTLNSYRLFTSGIKSWAERVLAAMDEVSAPLPAEGVITIDGDE